MLQSIEYGMGPPTYIYSNKTSRMTEGIFHVYASQLNDRKSKRNESRPRSRLKKFEEDEQIEQIEQFEQFESLEQSQEEKERYIQECYQKEYKEKNLISWK